MYLAHLAYNYQAEKGEVLDVFDKSRLFVSTMTLFGVKEEPVIREMFESIAHELSDDGVRFF